MKCKRCGGSGNEPDFKTLRDRRLDSSLTQKQCADLMDISQSYLCDLEQGRRDWDADKLARFASALKRKQT